MRDANELPDKAEAALAAVTKAEAVTGEVWRLNQQIARLREAAANRREKPHAASSASKLPSCTGDSSRSSARLAAHRAVEAENEQATETTTIKGEA